MQTVWLQIIVIMNMNQTEKSKISICNIVHILDLSIYPIHMVFSGVSGIGENVCKIHLCARQCGWVFCRMCKKLRALHAVACNAARRPVDYQIRYNNHRMGSLLFPENAIHHISTEPNRFRRRIPIK